MFSDTYIPYPRQCMYEMKETSNVADGKPTIYSQASLLDLCMRAADPPVDLKNELKESELMFSLIPSQWPAVRGPGGIALHGGRRRDLDVRCDATVEVELYFSPIQCVHV